MYNNVGAQPGGQQTSFPQAIPFGNAFSGATSGLISSGLSVYREKIFGSSFEYVQSNAKFPIPIYDINAPDLYIPMMAFLSYVVLAGFSLGLSGKFNPKTVNWLLMKGLVGWIFQVVGLKVSLMSLSIGEAPLLDIVAYAGYGFTGISLALLGKLFWRHSYYIVLLLSCLSMGIFLVKTMKRVLYAEVRSHNSGKHHVLLLLIALAQFPLFLWLGNITINWLF